MADKPTWRHIFAPKYLLFILGMSFLISLITGLLTCGWEFSSELTNYVPVATILSFSLWLGCESVVAFLDSRVSWLNEPAKRLILSLLLIALLNFLVITILGIIVVPIFYNIPVSSFLNGLHLNQYILPFIVSVLITMFFHGKSFLNEWRAALLNAEHLKQESLNSRYQMLRNQVNPHFLFNSLNVLSSLVHKDQDLAVKFIRKLSELYRYTLDTRNEELVTLRQELEGLEAYLFLLRIRFGDSIVVENRLTATDDVLVVPLAFQMLAENAVKHNVVSKENPLKIELFRENEHLVVRNNLQPRSQPAESSGVGLPNINERYKIMIGKELKAEFVDGFFVVNLPVVENN